MRTGGGILKNNFGTAKGMDELTAAASTNAGAAATMSTLPPATAGAAAANGKSIGTVKGAYKSARENRAATIAAAEALASFPTSAAAISTPEPSRREQPPPLTAADSSMLSSAIKTPHSAKKKKAVKYVKDPRAPKRFKSAFIFFTMHRHKTTRKEIEEKLGKGDRVRSYNCIYLWRHLFHFLAQTNI